MRKKFYEDLENEYYIRVGRYVDNNRLYIGIYNQVGDIVCNVTINLSDANIKSNNQIFLAGNISNTIKDKVKTIQKYNMGEYPVVNVNFEALKEYDSKGVEDFFNSQPKHSDEKLNQYNVEEIKSLLNSNTKLVYFDIGVNEYVIRYEDLPDAIIDFNNKFGMVDIKVYEYPNPSFEPILTTYGTFLDKCDPKVRSDIIDRLLSLQTEKETIKEYKIIDEDELENLQDFIENEEMEK